MTTADGILRGPDLNSSKSPLDKKLYRQILLPNGLRALLISDTIAMHQHHPSNDGSYENDDSGDDECSMEELEETEKSMI